MASGAVALIFSFLPFYKAGDESVSAWSGDSIAFPLVPLIVLIAVGLAAQVAMARFGNAAAPRDVGGFTFSDLRLLLGKLGTLTMLGFLLISTFLDKGVGLIFILLAMIGFFVSAIMERQGTPMTAGDAGGRREPSPGDLTVLAAGVVILIASFLDFFDFSGGAWSEGLIPLFLIPALLGVVMAIQVAVTRFTDSSMPGQILGISWREQHLAFGAWAALMMVCFLIADTGDKAIGFWLTLLAAIGLLVGAVLKAQEGDRPAAPARGAQAPPPPPPPA